MEYSRADVLRFRDTIADGCIVEPEVGRFINAHLPFESLGSTVGALEAVEVCNRWLEVNATDGDRLRDAIKEARDGVNC